MRRTHYRSCNLCEACCGVAVELDGDQIVSVRGDDADPFSRGYICPKATALKDIHEDPNRLRRPLRKRPGSDEYDEIGWDEAYDLVASKLREIRDHHGKDAIAIYQGNPTAHNLSLLTYGQVFLRSLGTRNIYSATSADQLPHMLSSLKMFGNHLMFPIPDIDRTDFFLMLGANPVVSNGSIMTAPGVRRRLKALRARGGKLVVVDPRRTETAQIADQHFFVKPGSDALLLLALLNTIFADGNVDLKHLASCTINEDQVRAIAAEFSPERVAGVVGIAADDIRQLARDFAAADKAVCYGRFGVSTQRFGAVCSWLINVLNIVTGHFDRPGGAMFTTPAVDLVKASTLAKQDGGFNRWTSRVSGLPEFAGELPVSVLAEEMETPGRGRIRAFITSAGNPVLSIPNGPRLERAMENLDFMVSIDFYVNETTRHADVILPPTFGLEHDHYDLAFFLVSVRNVAKFSPPAIERSPEQRHDWEIMLELSRRVAPTWWGRALANGARAIGKYADPRQIIDLGLRAGPYKQRVKDLLAQPHGVDFGPLQSRLPDYLQTADGRLDLAPALYVGDVDRLRRSLDETSNGELLLIGRRHLRSNNSWMHNSERLVKGKPRCTLLMHPTDAEARGVSAGQTVAVRSRIGQVEAPVEVSDEVMQGVVSLPHGWGHHRPGMQLDVATKHPGVSVNDITDERFYDELSGNAGFSGVPVHVEPK